jgi:hypothetical protein
MTEAAKTESFWKSSKGMILKIAGLIGAVSTIVTLVLQMVSYMKESEKRGLEAKIESTVRQYYAVVEGAQQCSKVAELFEPVVDDYFGKSGLTKDQVETDCLIYRNRWAYYQNIPDYSTISTRKLDNGNYFTTYQLLYKVKRKTKDNWKIFNLRMSVEFSKNFKIKSIFEKIT